MYTTHEMRMVHADESGVEEWLCSTCGRRILLRWPPHYEKRVAEPGDEKANHVGTAADLASFDTTAADTPTRSRWLRETGIRSVAPLTPP